jgi:hypothetical protein
MVAVGLQGPRRVPGEELAAAAMELGAAAARGRAERGARPSFDRHADRRAAQQAARIEALLGELPPCAEVAAVGGAAAAAQLPSAAVAALVRGRLRSKAGPDGGRAHSALRAWRLLRTVLDAGADRPSPVGSEEPAREAVVAYCVALGLQRATIAGRGSQGGRTVGATLRDGFVYLQEVVGLPIEANGALVKSAAEPPKGGAPVLVRHSASLPIAVYCQLEWLAARPEATPTRVIARALLTACAVHSIRLNDALNAVVFADEADPEGVVRGRTVVASKHGLPLELYAPAEGFLGPFGWLGEHLTSGKMCSELWATPGRVKTSSRWF